ncbi:dTDP-4-dehydrorhamnose 3,5-epimerase [Candidatus Pacearchaeota archaeon]|nr:dTDP-4-dehydrorhamnose 3,5-epimerase [Candidatus Pacearchaeota archaeon]
MLFTETELEGAFVIELEKFEDERGFFARTWCRKEFEAQGLNVNLAQCNTSFNRKKGTLRGMHYQTHPHKETKLVRCTKGALYDVIIDLRSRSKTYTKWIGVELTAENRKMLYVPEGFAHGFQTLVNDTEVFYQMTAFFVSESGRGVRWDDPLFDIKWPPEDDRILSDKDRLYEDFDPESHIL